MIEYPYYSGQYSPSGIEAAVQKRALQLTQGQPPEFNIAPTMELVRMAWSRGYDLVLLTVAQKQAISVGEAP